MPGGGSRVEFALTLIALGALFLLKELGYLKGNVLRYWPVLLIVWGIGMFYTGKKR